MPPVLDHLGIAVRDLDAACRLYAALGLQPEGREVVEQEQVEVVMLPLASGRIELLHPTSPAGSVARFLERRGEGLHHIALRVPDLGAAIDRAKASGLKLVKDGIQIGAGGNRYVFVHPVSIGGVLLELVEEPSA